MEENDHLANTDGQKVGRWLVPGNVLWIMEVKLQTSENSSLPGYRPGPSHFTVLFGISD